MDLTFWYWGENCIGKKKELEEKQENSEIMKEPKMTEKELVTIVSGQKNGKAAGVDGVRAELLKSLIKNSTIREHLLKCCNRCLNESVQEDWLRLKLPWFQKIASQKSLNTDQ